MGYGVPLFDGDEPLPERRPRLRILSLRLWLNAASGKAQGEAPLVAHRHEEEDRASDGQWADGRRHEFP